MATYTVMGGKLDGYYEDGPYPGINWKYVGVSHLTLWAALTEYINKGIDQYPAAGVEVSCNGRRYLINHPDINYPTR